MNMINYLFCSASSIETSQHFSGAITIVYVLNFVQVSHTALVALLPR